MFVNHLKIKFINYLFYILKFFFKTHTHTNVLSKLILLFLFPQYILSRVRKLIFLLKIFYFKVIFKTKKVNKV